MKEPLHPGSLPRWLRSQPALMAMVLGAINRLRRLAVTSRSARGAMITLVTMLGTAGGVAAIVLLGMRTQIYAWLAGHAPLVSAVAGVHALLAIRRRRIHVAGKTRTSWLMATPVFVAARARTQAVQVFGPLVVQLLASGAVIAILGTSAGTPGDTLASLLRWLAGGAALGAAVGACWPQREIAERTEHSRYVPRARGRAFEPSLSGLSRWPVLQAISWHRPENSRVLFILAALSVPLGSSAVLGLAIVAFWTLASYMATLLRAVSHVGRDASAWLRATPIGFAQFAWALSRRALVHQAIGTTLVGATLFLMGTPVPTVLRLGIAWLAIVVVVWAIALADAWRARPSALRVLLYASATIAAEYRAHGWAFPLALIVAAAHVLGAMKHARP